MTNTVTIKKGHERRIRSGHLWVFSNELVSVPDYEAGSVVEVQSSRGESFGYGFYNPHSLIAVRLLQTGNEINTGLFIQRIKDALDYRNLVLPGEEIYRFVFGESDFLPGLVIDRYGDYLSVQMLSAGMEQSRQMIIDALLEVIPGIKGIIEKNNSKLREIEGLPLREGVIYGSIPEEFQTLENNIKLNISLSEGQKTGYFLDQKINRRVVGSLSNGRSVLDCFCNQGGFALNAARGGAKKVMGVDSSPSAIERAGLNASSNGFENTEFIVDDVVTCLQNEISKGCTWDMVILDPPAFAKNKKSVPTAKAGYARINKLALKLIPRYGFLATSSCSQHITEDVFYEIVLKEAESRRRQLKLVYRGMQAPDHPVLSSMPETKYLKFFIFQVI
jgi:23S rRNA (cytosine1962-C5)-methyltransferase